MPKTKTFAEKMLKSKKPPVDFEAYKVISTRPKPSGTLRYVSRVVKVRKTDNEKEVLGI